MRDFQHENKLGTEREQDGCGRIPTATDSDLSPYADEAELPPRRAVFEPGDIVKINWPNFFANGWQVRVTSIGTRLDVDVFGFEHAGQSYELSTDKAQRVKRAAP